MKDYSEGVVTPPINTSKFSNSELAARQLDVIIELAGRVRQLLPDDPGLHSDARLIETVADDIRRTLRA